MTVSDYLIPVTLLSLGAYAATSVARALAESLRPSLRVSQTWRDRVLPTLPIVSGVLIGYGSPNFPWPGLVGDSLAGRGLLGAACGLFSTLVYKKLRAAVKNYEKS